jgi:hypothetical protein
VKREGIGDRAWVIEIVKSRPPYTLRGDGKSAEVIERKADTRGPLRKRVRKILKANGLNKTDRKEYEAMGRWLGIKSGLEFGKHEKE